MFERIMGLEVYNPEVYEQYRTAMAPILAQYGGEFGYDFLIEKTLKSKTPEPINRVFTLGFSSREAMDAFFSDPDYLRVKQRYLDHSVGAKTVIAMHERDD